MSAGIRRLPVINTVKEAYSITWDRLRIALAFSGFPLVLAFAILVVSSYSGQATFNSFALVFFVGVLLVSTATALLVGQSGALGIPLPTSPLGLYVNVRFWKYVGAAIFAGVAPIATFAAALWFATLFWAYPPVFLAVMIVAYGFGAYVTFKLTLLTPSMASGEGFFRSIEASWRLTKGNFIRILTCLLLSVLPVALLQAIVSSGTDTVKGILLVVLASIAVLMSALQALIIGAVGGVAIRELSEEA